MLPPPPPSPCGKAERLVSLVCYRRGFRWYVNRPSLSTTDSPYDVSGLPYQENYDEDTKPPQQVSLSYDESLESGYSTPNRRRIIREIIV